MPWGRCVGRARRRGTRDEVAVGVAENELVRAVRGRGDIYVAGRVVDGVGDGVGEGRLGGEAELRRLRCLHLVIIAELRSMVCALSSSNILIS